MSGGLMTGQQTMTCYECKYIKSSEEVKDHLVSQTWWVLCMQPSTPGLMGWCVTPRKRHFSHWWKWFYFYPRAYNSLFLPAVSSRVTKNEYIYNARPTRAIIRWLLSPTPLLADAFMYVRGVFKHETSKEDWVGKWVSFVHMTKEVEEIRWILWEWIDHVMVNSHRMLEVADFILPLHFASERKTLSTVGTPLAWKVFISLLCYK